MKQYLNGNIWPLDQEVSNSDVGIVCVKTFHQISAPVRVQKVHIASSSLCDLSRTSKFNYSVYMPQKRQADVCINKPRFQLYLVLKMAHVFTLIALIWLQLIVRVNIY